MVDASNLKNLAVSDTGFVFDPRTGTTFTLNATGRVALAALRDGGSVDDVAARLEASFDGVSPSVREEVLDFVQSLRAHGLVA